MDISVIFSCHLVVEYFFFQLSIQMKTKWANQWDPIKVELGPVT
jgi:hypothetical protein